MRSGHCGLNSYLHRFGKADSPYCECGYGKETVQHYLLECRKFKDQRASLRTTLGAERMRMEWILGHSKATSATLEYIHRIGRLQQA